MQGETPAADRVPDGHSRRTVLLEKLRHVEEPRASLALFGVLLILAVISDVAFDIYRLLHRVTAAVVGASH